MQYFLVEQQYLTQAFLIFPTETSCCYLEFTSICPTSICMVCLTFNNACRGMRWRLWWLRTQTACVSLEYAIFNEDSFFSKSIYLLPNEWVFALKLLARLPIDFIDTQTFPCSVLGSERTLACVILVERTSPDSYLHRYAHFNLATSFNTPNVGVEIIGFPTTDVWIWQREHRSEFWISP